MSIYSRSNNPVSYHLSIQTMNRQNFYTLQHIRLSAQLQKINLGGLLDVDDLTIASSEFVFGKRKPMDYAHVLLRQGIDVLIKELIQNSQSKSLENNRSLITKEDVEEAVIEMHPLLDVLKNKSI
ncbi:hypothetical protein GEMRC1_007974 [Eukaryota sp. GEM-RC1]